MKGLTVVVLFAVLAVTYSKEYVSAQVSGKSICSLSNQKKPVTQAAAYLVMEPKNEFVCAAAVMSARSILVIFDCTSSNRDKIRIKIGVTTIKHNGPVHEISKVINEVGNPLAMILLKNPIENEEWLYTRTITTGADLKYENELELLAVGFSKNGIVGSSRVKIIEDNEQTGELVATKDYLRKYKERIGDLLFFETRLIGFIISTENILSKFSIYANLNNEHYKQFIYNNIEY